MAGRVRRVYTDAVALDPLTTMPARFAAGTTLQLKRSHADFPASVGWKLTLYLAGVSKIEPVESTADGDDHLLTVTATATAQLDPGQYRWVERAELGGAVYVAAEGTVVVDGDIAGATAGEFQTWEEKTLAVVEAALTGRLTSDMESYQIAGRAVTKIPVADLMKLRSQLTSAVQVQRGGGAFCRDVLVSFPKVRSAT